MPYLGGAQSTPPSGWLYCDGTDIPRASYGDLFAAIGTSFGSTSSTTFTLPTSMRLMSGANNFGVGNSSSSHVHYFTSNGYISTNSESAHGHSFNAASSSYYEANHYHQSNAANTNNSGANTLLVSGSANLTARDDHGHSSVAEMNSAWGHQHGGNAGSLSNTNSHSHAHYSASSQNSTTPKSGGSTISDYPPYILVWHIIKT